MHDNVDDGVIDIMNEQNKLSARLISAIMDGQIDAVIKAIDDGASIYEKDNFALKVASEYGRLDIVKFLAEEMADIHANDNYAVKIASREGHLEVVKYLIEKGANFKAQKNYALRWAAHNGLTEMFVFLANKGADIYAQDSEALRSASRLGHHEIVDFILKNKPSKSSKINSEIRLDAIKSKNNAALKLAAKGGHMKVVKLLIDAGAIIEPYNDQAIHWAKKMKHATIAEYIEYKLITKRAAGGNTWRF